MIINEDLLRLDEMKKLVRLEDILRDYLGDSGLLEEILRAMTYEEEKDILEFIARMHDVEVDK
jgi:hypothetical protein